MEEIKEILGKHGTKHVQLVKRSDGSMYIRSSAPPWNEVEIGNSAYAYDVPRTIAHAILELIGDPVPGKGDGCYIAVVKDGDSWVGGKINASVVGPSTDADRVIDTCEHVEGEYHIFRRVATVGPIPQPGRKVTRYE